MIVLYVIILLLVVIIVLLSITLYIFSKKSIYLSRREKDYILFTINIFSEYSDELGIQSKDQHKLLVEELEKLKKKHFVD